MLISDFDYELPPELIAQHPLGKRDASRMLVVDRSTGEWHDHAFGEFPSFIRKDDVIVLNNTRVFPARLIGNRQPSGGRVELFLIRELEGGTWEALSRPARRLQPGAEVIIGGGQLRATVIEALEDGHRIVKLESKEPLEIAIERFGQIPLPPYIKRDAGESANEDRERYQTVFARERGAIAAPTAGLHFTPEVIEQIAGRGIKLVEITLHVGYGTFEPVRVEELREHQVAPERFLISSEAARIMNNARLAGGRLISVGTTTTRALESMAEPDGTIKAGSGSASLTITPGYRFRAVDALLTNFHLPRSSLLVLVSTFGSHNLIMSAYRHAVEEKYRFYSYGDCMLII
jgi:S-adenosylmethionine:tRNA ribosyltransferase-isomerase